MLVSNEHTATTDTGSANTVRIERTQQDLESRSPALEHWHSFAGHPLLGHSNVAGAGFEPTPRGYEPHVLPLH